MKIAIPYHNGYVNDHFGHADKYSVYSVSPDNSILNSEIVESNLGCGCRSGIAEILAGHGVTVMLAGNIGAGAIQHLYTNGINVIRGCSGPVESVVNAYLQGAIVDNNQTCQEHEKCEDKHLH